MNGATSSVFVGLALVLLLATGSDGVSVGLGKAVQSTSEQAASEELRQTGKRRIVRSEATERAHGDDHDLDLPPEDYSHHRFVSEASAEEKEDLEAVHGKGEHIDPKIADAWLNEVMAKGLKPRSKESAAREMDSWVRARSGYSSGSTGTISAPPSLSEMMQAARDPNTTVQESVASDIMDRNAASKEMDGLSGDRMNVGRHDIHMPDIAIRKEDPIDLPVVGGFGAPPTTATASAQATPRFSTDAEPAKMATTLSTCTPDVCTHGWSVKLGLSDNFPCESSPCTEVECCQLVQKQEAAPAPAPCPPSEPVSVEVIREVPHKMTPKEALALDAIIGCVGLLFCFIGFYLGRKWTHFQQWMAEPPEEEEEERKAEGGTGAAASASGTGAAAGAKKK